MTGGAGAGVRLWRRCFSPSIRCMRVESVAWLAERKDVL